MNDSVDKPKQQNIENESFGKMLVRLGAPICIANIITIFTTVLTNDIYSANVGQNGFSIMGALAMALTVGNSITGSVALAAWIKGAPCYGNRSGETASRQCRDAVWALLLLSVSIIAIMLLAQEYVFQLMNVPADIWDDAKKYYVVFVWQYIFYGLSLFFNYIINAKGSKRWIWFSNMWLAFSIVPIAFLFLKVFRLGVQGVALIMCVQYFLWMAVNYILLRKQKILGKIAKKDLLPDFSRVGKIISYGLLLAAQMLLCVIAEVIVSLQANRYLSVEYIAVIAVSLPIQGVLSGVTSSMCTAFIPQNYKAGNSERLKSFMRKVLALGVGYAVFCFVIYASIGEWYYYRLFQDMAMAAMGSEYWFWYGLSIIPVAIIGIVRVFFDSIDKGSISMLSGIGELLGRIVCGFWLIPMFGNIGRSLASLLGWGTGALFLLIAYAILRKSIYRQCEQYKSV